MPMRCARVSEWFFSKRTALAATAKRAVSSCVADETPFNSNTSSSFPSLPRKRDPWACMHRSRQEKHPAMTGNLLSFSN